MPDALLTGLHLWPHGHARLFFVPRRRWQPWDDTDRTTLEESHDTDTSTSTPAHDA